MKLTSLKLANFRCFDDVAIDLNVDGLIGVVGPNGAGKSTLFAAVEWALFGTQRGPGSLAAHRDGTDKKHCRVEVEFLLAEQQYRVVRTPASGELWLLDTETRIAKGTTPTTAAVAVTLGMSRDSFLSTFYARQREVQALDARGDAGRRRAQLERLLGIERLRQAVNLARAQAHEQQLIVRAQGANAVDPGEALAELRAVEDQARQRAPAVETVRTELKQARKGRRQARKALEAIERRATHAQQAESKAKLAAAEATAARTEASRAAAMLSEAREAQERLAGLSPLAARGDELRARERELEIRRQATEQTAATRARWERAQSAATRLHEQLSQLADEREALQDREQQLRDAQEATRAGTGQSLEIRDQLNNTEAKQREADRRAREATRAHDLDALLTARDAAQKEADRAAGALSESQAELLDVKRRLQEEREHHDAVRRDGPDAECPRCLRAYGSDYETILSRFAEELAALEQSQATLEEAVRTARTRRSIADEQVAELAALQRERALLGVIDDPGTLREMSQALATRHAELVAERDRLETERQSAKQRVPVLKQEIERLTERVSTWHRLAYELQAVRRDADLFAAELEGARVDGYHAPAHEALRAELKEAQAAEQQAASLRGFVEQLSVLEKRASQTASRARETESESERLAIEAQAVSIEEGAVDAAKDKDVAAEKAVIAAGEALHAAEQRAIREDEAVKRAREALERAQEVARQLRSQRREQRTRARLQELLEEYRSHASRRALPELEQETAALLAAITRGRYVDVRLSDGYALELHDGGEPHTLRRFSGGEQDVANLCLRLALSRALARQRGTEAGFVILDEVLGSQDPDRRAALMGELRELTREFRQVFVVSHFADIADSCDIHLQLSRPEPPAPADVVRG